MTTYAHATTASLDVAYLEWNPRGERVAVLLHGWPDSPVGWDAVAARLAAHGYRVLAPALRGFAPTRFRDASVPRSNSRRSGATCSTSSMRSASSGPCWSGTTGVRGRPRTRAGCMKAPHRIS